jgi:predicted cobalt transporter CbtA
VGPFRGVTGAGEGGGLRDAGGDAAQVVLDYVKQETLEPVKGLGRFLIFGVSGSLLLAVGVVLLLVGVLRVLQTETGTALTGNLSWVPYGCVAALGLVVMALAAWRVVSGPAARRRPSEEGKS